MENEASCLFLRKSVLAQPICSLLCLYAAARPPLEPPGHHSGSSVPSYQAAILALGYPLDELVLRQAVEGTDGQLRDEALAGQACYVLAASEVQQGEARDTAQVRQAGVRQLTASWGDGS